MASRSKFRHPASDAGLRGRPWCPAPKVRHLVLHPRHVPRGVALARWTSRESVAPALRGRTVPVLQPSLHVSAGVVVRGDEYGVEGRVPLRAPAEVDGGVGGRYSGEGADQGDVQESAGRAFGGGCGGVGTMPAPTRRVARSGSYRAVSLPRSQLGGRSRYLCRWSCRSSFSGREPTRGRRVLRPLAGDGQVRLPREVTVVCGPEVESLGIGEGRGP